MGKYVRILLIAVVALAMALGGAAYWARREVRASLPLITGRLARTSRRAQYAAPPSAMTSATMAISRIRTYLPIEETPILTSA